MPAGTWVCNKTHALGQQGSAECHFDRVNHEHQSIWIFFFISKEASWSLLNDGVETRTKEAIYNTARRRRYIDPAKPKSYATYFWLSSIDMC